MFIINQYTLRNLEEQVQKNKEDIAQHYNIDRVLAGFGIRVIGQVNDASQLPDPETFTGNYGDAYAVGETDPYNFYIWTRADVNAGHPEDYWFDIGPLAIAGQPGPKGDKGDKGDPGISTKWISSANQPALTSQTPDGTLFLNTATGNIYEAASYQDGSRYWKLTGNIKGPQGIQGIQGLQGPKGETGAQGPQGIQGDVGGFVNIWGTLSNVDQLPTPASLNNLTVAYLIEHTGGTDQANDHYDLYIQVGATSDVAVWTNAGPFNAATLVTSGGVGLNVWDADTKLDKKTTLSQKNQAYVKTTAGANTLWDIDTDISGNSIVRRDTTGNILVPLTPNILAGAASKKYVDDQIAANSGNGAALYMVNTLLPPYGLDLPYTTFPENIRNTIKVGDNFIARLHSDQPSAEAIGIGLWEITALPDYEINYSFSTAFKGDVELLVDDELSTESTNPVQNKVVTEELNKKASFYEYSASGDGELLSDEPFYLRASGGIMLKTAYGTTYKVLSVHFANDNLVKTQSENMPFSTNQISLAVRAGLISPRITWTDEEKALARETLGVRDTYRHTFVTYNGDDEYYLYFDINENLWANNELGDDLSMINPSLFINKPGRLSGYNQDKSKFIVGIIKTGTYDYDLIIASSTGISQMTIDGVLEFTGWERI